MARSKFITQAAMKNATKPVSDKNKFYSKTELKYGLAKFFLLLSWYNFLEVHTLIHSLDHHICTGFCSRLRKFQIKIVKSMKGITCSKYAQHNAFKGFRVCLDVILCGSKRIVNLAVCRTKQKLVAYWTVKSYLQTVDQVDGKYINWWFTFSSFRFSYNYIWVSNSI